MLIEDVKKLPIKERLLYWIFERHKIYRLREQGQAKPWTNDEILQSYRFCNVYRNLDTVTQWIHENWLKPNAGNADLWFAMAVSRWINWPDTLNDIGFPVPWDPELAIKLMNCRKELGEKVWTGAYLIGTQGNAKDKIKFICEDVLTPLWENREELRPQPGDTLVDFGKRIVAVKNQGRFMVGQIIADIKYDELCYLYHASDWHTFALPGPGSCRGINRIYGTSYTRGMGPKPQLEWHGKILEIQELINDNLDKLELPEPLHAQDTQSCLCEFDKYERVLWGEGTPRANYPGV